MSTKSEWISLREQDNKCGRICGKEGTPSHCWREDKLILPPWTAVWKLLNKLEMKLPCNPDIPLLGVCIPKGLYILLYKYMIIHIYCSTIPSYLGNKINLSVQLMNQY